MPKLEDVYFTTHVTLGSESDIVKHYIVLTRRDGVEPERICALGYDAMYLIADALTSRFLEPNAIKEAHRQLGPKGSYGQHNFY